MSHAAKDAPERSEPQAGAALAPSSCSSLPPVLDACCGTRMMWFDKSDSRAIYQDIREEDVPGCNTNLPKKVAPDVKDSFTAMSFPDESFWHVVFDPPHHTSKRFGTCDTGRMKKLYGMLLPGWEEHIEAGFAECFRVLRPGGTLIFKWCSVEIPLPRVLELTPERPLYGHRSGKKGTTHWIAFLKTNNDAYSEHAGWQGGMGGELHEKTQRSGSKRSWPKNKRKNLTRKTMTDEQIDKLIAESPDSLSDALAEQRQNIAEAAKAAIEEASESDSKVKPVAITLKVTLDLNGSSPRAMVESRVGIVHKYVGDVIDLDETAELEPGMGKGRKGAG